VQLRCSRLGNGGWAWLSNRERQGNGIKHDAQYRQLLVLCDAHQVALSSTAAVLWGEQLGSRALAGWAGTADTARTLWQPLLQHLTHAHVGVLWALAARGVACLTIAFRKPYNLQCHRSSTHCSNIDVAKCRVCHMCIKLAGWICLPVVSTQHGSDLAWLSLALHAYMLDWCAATCSVAFLLRWFRLAGSTRNLPVWLCLWTDSCACCLRCSFAGWLEAPGGCC
jgi:hypothetical protein